MWSQIPTSGTRSTLDVHVQEFLSSNSDLHTQLYEHLAIAEWLQGEGGNLRGVHPDRVCGGGDSAGGNMTAALSFRLRDEGKRPLKAQILLCPEDRLSFDTLAAEENNTGFYVEC